MKYRKRPITIDAFPYEGQLSNLPIWAAEALASGILHYTGPDLCVKTLEGELIVSPGDYIIRGVAGELYPCKPDIFHQTYESAEDSSGSLSGKIYISPCAGTTSTSFVTSHA